uniref:Uncharacterized protein n=1 Tax=Vespula pensylvanica TaxID=30213 RepID=A0A834NQ03_VESPE|nr:hypothetical protein H0235_011967 [Vespula pensylvanica]
MDDPNSKIRRSRHVADAKGNESINKEIFRELDVNASSGEIARGLGSCKRVARSIAPVGAGERDLEIFWTFQKVYVCGQRSAGQYEDNDIRNEKFDSISGIDGSASGSCGGDGVRA